MDLIQGIAKVTITADGALGSVTVNGQDFPNASAVAYSHKAGEPPQLTLTLLCDIVEVEATEADVKVVYENGNSNNADCGARPGGV